MTTKALCILLVPAVAAGSFAAWPRSATSAASLPSPSLKQAAIVALAAAAASALPQTAHTEKSVPSAPVAESIDVLSAVERGVIKAEFKGNGRERMRAVLSNSGSAPLVVKFPTGQLLENGRNAVVVARLAELEIDPGKTAEIILQTVAPRSTNKIADWTYRLSYNSVPKIAALLAYAEEHLELSPGAIQTAVLALTDNLPLSAVAKFTPAGGELLSRFDTTAFRVETFDIISALAVLRAIGVQDHDLALTVDPQLRIEAMIEPLTRAAAMRYYGIANENEWEFWKQELLSGDPGTRHYALYGIARFYPEVALDMLPKWVRETKTNPVYRQSALQALADTQRAEALPILRQLADELGRNTELGRAAVNAAQYLDAHLTKISENGPTVAFRAGKEQAKF